jgi:ribonucleoside-diphosphate reductase alpha subunit
MRVIKRDGSFEGVSFDKILKKYSTLTATPAALSMVDSSTAFFKMVSELTPLGEVDPTFLAQQTIKGVYDGVTTQELDLYSASVAQSLSLINPQYSTLAGRIMASNLQKNIECHLAAHFGVGEDVIRSRLFLYVVRSMWANRNAKGDHSPLVAPYFMAIVEKNHEWIESVFSYSRDFCIDYMGYSILEGSYLFRSLISGRDGVSRRVIVEQPAHMFMRVAIGIECAPVDPTGPLRDKIESGVLELLRGVGPSLECAIAPKGLPNALSPFLENAVINTTKQNAQTLFESMMLDDSFGILGPKARTHITATYKMMSECLGTHATPTLFNAGSMTPQCSSCYLLPPSEDSLEGITNIWRSEAMISKWAGGIGSVIYSLRPQGSYIAGTNGTSNGIVPNLKVQNDIAVYVDQCFGTGTMVYGASGPVSIESIVAGDQILTGDGSYHTVTAVRAYTYHFLQHEDLIVIKTLGGETAIVTQRHPMLVLGLCGAEWVEAKDLNTTDHRLMGVDCTHQILSLETTRGYVGTLTDFDVDVAHNYVTNIGIAHNGGNKRPGSNAVYCAPWHGDIMAFLNLRKERGVESERARDLFYAMWIQDEFMRSVAYNRDWYLMCPDACPGLWDVYDAVHETKWIEDEELAGRPIDFAFTTLYRKYVREGKYTKVIKAVVVYEAICDLRTETGLPYMLYSDSANRKCNQMNVGTVKSSNLCCEIMEVATPDETAVCNLASLCLNNLVIKGPSGLVPDWSLLKSTVRTQVYNLNRIIDLNFYPTMNTRRSNLRHRPMGIGVQGLADLFVMLRIPFDSEAARELNFKIFERIYFYALEMSCELAQESGVYPSYAGSPASKGLLQFDLWIAEAARSKLDTPELVVTHPLEMDWEGLKLRISLHGLRNSLLVAPMPTASTAGIMGNSPCFEPHNSMIYKRRIKDGEFIIINKMLITDLIERGLWDTPMRDEILEKGGSIQDITEIPREIRELYKTVWDISPKVIINMALDRGVFVDQSQSMNLFIHAPNTKILSQVDFYGWKRGIKTGQYYVWGRAPIDAQKIQIDKQVGKMLKKVVPKSPSKDLEPSGASTITIVEPVVVGSICTREMRAAGCDSCGS